MPLFDQDTVRTYRCTNKACEAKMSYLEKVGTKWRKACPLCKKRTLILDHASLSISTFVDLDKPRTLGAIMDKNSSRRDKEGNPSVEKGKLPFWRKNKKINYKILKDSNKYIQTGVTP